MTINERITMKQPDIQHLIMQDLKFKMSAWRAIAIIALLLFSGVFGLFIGSEAELKSTKAKLNDTVNCQK
jgi:hypothetical protein